MLRYIARQLLFLLFTLFIITTLTFLMMKAVPGDPFMDEQALPAEVHQALLHHYGLDQPWYKQYGGYIWSVITFNLGPSFTYKHCTINEMIAEGFPVSALLGAEALAIAISSGIAFGTLAALRHKRWQDSGVMLLSTLAISAPTFLIATLLQYLVALKLGWLPIARWGSFAQTILPALSLAVMPAAHIMRLVRANLIEISQMDYIKVARAKGLTQVNAMIQHGLKNALIPLLPYFGQLSANILTGSFIIEKIYSIPGLGQWFVLSVQNRDYTAIMGLTVFYSTLLLCFLVIADCLYRYLYPQMRRESFS